MQVENDFAASRDIAVLKRDKLGNQPTNHPRNRAADYRISN